ncbi:MAG: hypothetical protein PHC62_04530 [Candidatus Izemoplasmatales bacterium]|jgi:hypothetical protein|nr:hypothetical protein [Candidatus Izemoplasmatales bacterium]
MKAYKKPFKFYLLIFVFSALIILAYSVYLYFKGEVVIKDMLSLWFLPFFFTLIYYVGDVFLYKISNRRKKIDYEALFLEAIAQRMRDSKKFIIEDFRKLQINERFQTQVKNAYEIYKNGETELYTLDKIDKKFKDDTLEARALKYVIEFVKEKLEENQK